LNVDTSSASFEWLVTSPADPARLVNSSLPTGE